MVGPVQTSCSDEVRRSPSGRWPYGSAQPHRDIPRFISLYQQGLLKLDELVSATYPLEQFDTVVADMHAGRLARGVLTF